MAEKESPVKKFTDYVNEYLWLVIQCKEDEIRKMSSNLANIEEVRKILLETNGLIDFFCEDDEELYDLLRYRLFYHSDTNKVTIIQGEEIEIDYRGLVDLVGPMVSDEEDETFLGRDRTDDEENYDEGDEDNEDDDWRLR